MTDTFHCPNCGAPLDYDRDGDLVIRCPYCSSAVIAPEALRSAREPDGTASAASGSMDADSLMGQAAHLGEIAQLIRKGRKIEAIKRYREISGLGLREAKGAVEALQAGRPVTFVSTQSSSTGSVSAQSIDIDVEAAARTATRVGAGIGCAGVVTTGLILLAVLVLVIFVLIQPEGPLFETWSRINPAAANRLLVRFGAEGTGTGFFQDPRHVVLDANGNLYVADFDTGRIQRFDAEGNFLGLWRVADEAIIRDLAADRDGNVYAVFDGEIVYYNGNTGDRLGRVTYPAEEQPYFEQVALAADGSIVTIANGEDLIRFDRSGLVTLELPDAISAVSNDSELDAHPAVDGLGNIFILGTFNNAVFKFAQDGSFITRFGSAGDEPGQFRAPGELAIDNQGLVYVTDFKGVQIFDNNGRYLDVVPTSGYSHSLALREGNELYVVTSSSEVLGYSLGQP